LGAFFLQKNINTRYIVMIILTTSASQTFPIIPISQIDLTGNSIRLEFTNETTKEIITKTATTRTSTNDIYTVGSTDLSFLKENTFYVLKAYFNLTNVVIYKDRVFVTNQSQSSYSINNGQYTSTSIDNNSYITI
jgi:hypothetical protein